MVRIMIREGHTEGSATLIMFYFLDQSGVYIDFHFIIKYKFGHVYIHILFEINASCFNNITKYMTRYIRIEGIDKHDNHKNMYSP